MKTNFLIGLIGLATTFHSFSQGQFLFANYSAPTRIGSPDGPLAGRGIWAQMLVGLQVNALEPVWMPLEHVGGGIVGNPVVTVPGIDCFYPAYLQLVAWNGNLWGTDYSAVPQDQLGKTEIRGMTLGCYPYAIYAPLFQQPAIVPVPEPSVVALTVVGAGLLLWRTRSRKDKLSPD